MKKVLLSVAVIASMAMVSCGSDALCECAEAEKEMRGLIDKAENEEAEDKIRDSFKDKKDACKKLYKEFKKEIKDLSADEKKAKMEEMEESCPAMKR